MKPRTGHQWWADMIGDTNRRAAPARVGDVAWQGLGSPLVAPSSGSEVAASAYYAQRRRRRRTEAWSHGHAKEVP